MVNGISWFSFDQAATATHKKYCRRYAEEVIANAILALTYYDGYNRLENNIRNIAEIE